MELRICVSEFSDVSDGQLRNDGARNCAALCCVGAGRICLLCFGHQKLKASLALAGFARRLRSRQFLFFRWPSAYSGPALPDWKDGTCAMGLGQGSPCGAKRR